MVLDDDANFRFFPYILTAIKDLPRLEKLELSSEVEDVDLIGCNFSATNYPAVHLPMHCTTERFAINKGFSEDLLTARHRRQIFIALLILCLVDSISTELPLHPLQTLFSGKYLPWSSVLEGEVITTAYYLHVVLSSGCKRPG